MTFRGKFSIESSYGAFSVPNFVFEKALVFICMCALVILFYIKGIHNTAADAISRLEYDPKVNSTNEYNHSTHRMSTKEVTSQRWLMFSKLWSCYNEAQEDSDETNTIQLNKVFANHSKDNEIYPLTITEIVDTQKADRNLKNSLNPMQH